MCPTSCKVSEKSNGPILRNSPKCRFLAKMAPFLGPFCPYKAKDEFSLKFALFWALYAHIRQNTNFLKKSEFDTFYSVYMPNFLQSFRKSNEPILRNSPKCRFFAKMGPFWALFAHIRPNTNFPKTSGFVTSI